MTPGERVKALFAAFAVVVCLAALPGVALAEDAEMGRRQFKRGQELLKQADYRSAARAFEAGYAAAPRVGFLLNIGNCYRKLGELGKAREYYWRFLDAAPKDHPSRPAVMDYLRAMEQIEADGVSVDATSSGKAGPPPAAVELEMPVEPSPAPRVPPRLQARAPADPAAGLTVVDVRRPEPAAKPIHKRWWFWTLIGGAVAAGAATYVLTRPAGSSCGASLGCARE